MTIGGLVLLIIGIISAVVGSSQNNNMESQWKSIMTSGQTNPGNVLLYIGIAVAAIGLVLFIAGIVKNNRK